MIQNQQHADWVNLPASDGQLAADPGVPASAMQPDDVKQRLKLDPENVDKGLAQLVLTIIQLIRQLMEKQAVHRMEAGDLTDGQIEKMGQTFLMLDEKLHELMEQFDLDEDDLNIHLGPLGDLM